MAKKKKPASVEEEKAVVPKFNLLDESWIAVLTEDGDSKEVSLSEVFEQAPEIIELAGETETQNVAVMRLLLAILHKVMTQYDPDSGEELELEDMDEALDRWFNVWQNGYFPIETIDNYLQSYHDRFWLIHPEQPFWQANLAKTGTESNAAKLFSDLSESSNKVRLFQSRSYKGKDFCSLQEAARSILFKNGYDDTSLKSPFKGDGPAKAGWIGRTAQIYAQGHSLFETLMLNLCLLRDGAELWPEDHPIWEQNVKAAERKKIPLPDNFSELLTLPSRWIYLLEENNQIKGYRVLGGLFFDPLNAYTEQFTLWRYSEGKTKKDPSGFIPRRHDPSKQLWRNFADYIPLKADENAGKNDKPVRIPGIILWLQTLAEDDRFPVDYKLSLKSSSVQYGSSDYFITNLTGDSIQLHSSLLRNLNSSWRNRIDGEIQLCTKLAWVAGILSKECAAANGASGERELQNAAQKGQEIFYSQIDSPFKKWLQTIDPKKDRSIDDKVNEWHTAALKTCLRMELLLIPEASSASAMFGRAGNIKSSSPAGKKKSADTESKGSKTTLYSIAEASQNYRRRIYHYLKGGETDGNDSSKQPG